MKRPYILLFIILLVSSANAIKAESEAKFWPVQSIDTMKYSRDVARQYLNDYGYDSTIDTQVKMISETGATHVAIGTPYDAEFVPFIHRWVKAARKYRLNVWFRGNLSGWENWFNYGDVTPQEHTQKILEFIQSNQDLFADGDIFTSCPECENGGEGDPRQTRKIAEYRQFLITEHAAVKKIFTSQNKNIITNYYSMNADVARLIMNRETTSALGGVVTIDHYVETPERLASDILDLASRSGGVIVLGEWGAPIPDIHGKMDEKAQAEWISQALKLLAKNPSVIGLNYWTNQGSSTALWADSQKPKKSVEAIQRYYSPPVMEVTIKNTAGESLFATVTYLGRGFTTDRSGKVSLPWPGYPSELSAQSQGYHNTTSTLSSLPAGRQVLLTLDPEQKNWWYSVKLLTYRLWQSIIRNIK